VQRDPAGEDAPQPRDPGVRMSGQYSVTFAALGESRPVAPSRHRYAERGHVERELAARVGQRDAARL
jgi:hypothetical protein